MKIAYISRGFPPRIGGVESHVAELATRLGARGIEVDVLTHEVAGAPHAEHFAPGVTVRRFSSFGAPHPLAISPQIAQYLHRHRDRYDVVHAHNYHADSPMLASIGRPARLVITPYFHGDGHTDSMKFVHRAYRLLARPVLDRAASIICVSRAEATEFEAMFPTAGRRVTVIPIGVDALTLIGTHAHPTDASVVLSVGRLAEYKRVDVTLRSVGYLRSDFIVRVIGDGPDRARLQAIAAKTGGRAALLGRLSNHDLARALRTASVVVSCSQHESYGIVLADALAAGARVVATAIPAHEELAQVAGESMVLVDAQPRASEVARAIHVAAERPSMAPELLPTWAEVADQHLRVYERITARQEATA